MLALVTGSGALPAAVARSQPSTPLICALRGHTPGGLTPDLVFRMEELGSFLGKLGALGVTDVCLCGAIQRPEIDPLQVDADTKLLLPILNASVADGEDNALRPILGIFEQVGFIVRAAHELAPDLLPAAGVPTIVSVPKAEKSSVSLAQEVLNEQARADLGQSCVIRNGTVVAREGPEGTDFMLGGLIRHGCASHGHALGTTPFEFAEQLIAWTAAAATESKQVSAEERRKCAKGGFLFKASKPGQDLRVDLPTIGPRTALIAAEAGLDGIVVEAGRVMVLDLDQTLSILNAMGMYLWVR